MFERKTTPEIPAPSAQLRAQFEALDRALATHTEARTRREQADAELRAATAEMAKIERETAGPGTQALRSPQLRVQIEEQQSRAAARRAAAVTAFREAQYAVAAAAQEVDRIHGPASLAARHEMAATRKRLIAAVEQAAATLRADLHAVAEINRILNIGRGYVEFRLLHPDGESDLGMRPPPAEVDAALAPWREYYRLCRGAEFTWSDLPSAVAAE